MEIKHSDFVKSAVHERDYPEDIGLEFAFVGKSNVGKSSLINSVTNRKKLAKTSKTPGRTQLVNYFLINKRCYFVDLPGYGFAKVPLYVKDQWGTIIENYLQSPRKKIVFLLLDIRRIPSDDDKNLIDWLEYYNINFRVIFTKVDKLSNNQRFRQIKEIKKKFPIFKYDPFFYSALSKEGRDKLLEFIETESRDQEIVDIKTK